MSTLPPRSTLFPYTTLFRSGLATMVQRIDNKLLMIAKNSAELRRENGELRSAKQHLEKMLAEGVFAFTKKVDARSEEHSLNSSHLGISYAVFCLKKKKNKTK